MHPPQAKEKEHVTILHGEKILDPFFWLRAQNWQEVMRDPSYLDPEIKSHLEKENAYTDHILSDTTELQKTLFEEMKARLKPDDSTVPLPDGPFEYFSNFIGTGQYPRFCRKDRLGKTAMKYDDEMAGMSKQVTEGVQATYLKNKQLLTEIEKQLVFKSDKKKESLLDENQLRD